MSNKHKDREHNDHGHGHGHDKDIKIIVNGREKIVHKKLLSFEEVVALAFENAPTENTVYTVSYRKADQHPESGTLTPGQTVKVKNNTTFNVTATDKS